MEKELNSNNQDKVTSSSVNQFDLPSFKCSECTYESIWKHAVKRHQRIHFKDDQSTGNTKRTKFECEHCPCVIDSWEEFKDHQAQHITSSETSQIRIRSRKTKNTLKQSNIKSIEKSKTEKQKSTKAITYKCKECQFESESDRNFAEHMRVHMLHGSGVFECKWCDFKANKKKIFLKHVEKLHWEDPSAHCEEIATKLESANQTLPRRAYKRGKYAHVPVKMTKDGLFECEHCSYQTAIRTALVKHQSKHLTS